MSEEENSKEEEVEESDKKARAHSRFDPEALGRYCRKRNDVPFMLMTCMATGFGLCILCHFGACSSPC